MRPLLDITAARVLIDGVFAAPRLAHPEGVAAHRDGSIWCGTENGDLIRVEPDGNGMSLIGSTGGFLLGLAFDSQGRCYACDLRHAAVFRHDPTSGGFDRFAGGGIITPNFPVVDEARGVLYVSDSHPFGTPGGGIWRYDLATGEGGHWQREPMEFANGMALAADGSGLFVVESTAARVSFVPILADGSAGKPSPHLEGVERVPDGIALAPDGTMFVSCYEPSRIWRKRPEAPLELLIEDPMATTLCHPTNIALTGGRMITANLGRWHLTEIDLSTLTA